MAGEDALFLAVRDLYSNYRTAYMNRKYYGYRLDSTQRLSTTIEVMIAIGASSTVGGWALWKDDTGAAIWGWFGALVALLAIAKPILQLSKQIERYTKLFIGHSDVYYDLDLLADEVAQKRSFTAAMAESYRKSMQRLKELATEDDPNPNKRLLQKCYDEVNRELLVERFWWPPRKSKKGAKR